MGAVKPKPLQGRDELFLLANNVLNVCAGWRRGGDALCGAIRGALRRDVRGWVWRTCGDERVSGADRLAGLYF